MNPLFFIVFFGAAAVTTISPNPASLALHFSSPTVAFTPAPGITITPNPMSLALGFASPTVSTPGVAVSTPAVRTFTELAGGVGGLGSLIGGTLDALTCQYAMDPGDCVDFRYDRSNALDAGETLAGPWSLTMSPEGAALGVSIRTDGAYADALVQGNTGIQFWLSVGPSYLQSASFAGTGSAVQIVAKMATTNNPARTYERSLLVTIRQR